MKGSIRARSDKVVRGGRAHTPAIIVPAARGVNRLLRLTRVEGEDGVGLHLLEQAPHRGDTEFGRDERALAVAETQPVVFGDPDCREAVVELPRTAGNVPQIVARVDDALTEPIPHPGRPIELSVTIGAAIAAPTDDVNTALSRADREMYARKHPGLDEVT